MSSFPLFFISSLLTIITSSNKQYSSSIEGFYKGGYFDQDKNSSIENGSCLLMIDHIKTMRIDNYSQKLIDHHNKSNVNDSNANLFIQAKLSKTRLSFLNTAAFKRDIHLFWFGIYDIYNGRIVLSNFNFSYFVWNKSISIHHSVNISALSISNRLCPETLSIQLSENEKIHFGNYTNCRHNMAVFDLSFVEKDTFYHQSNTYGICSLIAVSTTFYLLFKQYEYSNMMGRVVKVSFITLYLQFVYNGTICFLHFDVAMNFESLFTTFLVITFICIMNANLYQRMMRMIWTLRHPLNNANNVKILNFIKIMSFICILFLSQYLVMGQYAQFIYFLFLSDWLFQIIHNVKSGHIKSWKISVLMFHSLAKLFYPLYIYGCPWNIVQNETNFSFCALLICWSFLQIFVLISMDYKANSRWFIPEQMKPAHYKYHKTPNYDIDDGSTESCEDDEESDDDDERRRLKKKTDKENMKRCSICLEDIDWKREYETIMVTPCFHYFHDQCLTTWMQQRLTCPTCRTNLPPFT